jgi:hypothetical protein
MLFHQWDGWRRRRAQEYLALSPEQRYRKHQWRQVATFITLPGVLLGTAGFAAAYGSGLFSQPARTPACAPKVVPAQNRHSFDLVVMNATGESGVATSVGREMKRRDFKVVDMSNAPEDLYVRDPGVIYYGSKTLQAALTVRNQLPGARLFFDGRTNNTVSLVIGSGYKKLVDPPARETPRPSQIKVNVYNATYHEGLAKTVLGSLVSRGFKPGKMGNDPDRVYLPKDVALIRYGSDGDLAATRLAEHVAGARLVKVDRPGLTLDLVIGNRWTGLVPMTDVPALPPLVDPTPETIALPCTTAKK